MYNVKPLSWIKNLTCTDAISAVQNLAVDLVKERAQELGRVHEAFRCQRREPVVMVFADRRAAIIGVVRLLVNVQKLNIEHLT